jgi:hypothetical protein
VLQEIGNSLIKKAGAFLTGDRLFELLDSEASVGAVECLRVLLRVLGSFKASFFDYKARSVVEVPDNPWTASNNACFKRLDKVPRRHTPAAIELRRHGNVLWPTTLLPRARLVFACFALMLQLPLCYAFFRVCVLCRRQYLERCHDVLEVAQTAVQYRKLEGAEVGGSRGRTLTSSVMQVYSDFGSCVDRVRNLGFDALDLDHKFEDAW